MICSAFCCAQKTAWDNLAHPLFYAPLSASSAIEGPIDSIVEDKQGLMWFTTSNGLWRWDSHFLTKVSFPSTLNSAALPQIQHTFKDHQNRIWAGTSEGLFLLDQVRSELTPVEVQKVSDISIQNAATVSVANSEILVLAEDRKLFQFDILSKQLSSIPLPTSMRIYALCIDDKNTLWVGAENGLYYATYDHGVFGVLQKVNSLPNDARITTLKHLSSGQLIIGTARNGLFIKHQNKQYEHIELQGNAQSAWVYNVVEKTDNTLIIGTFGHGLVEIDLANRTQRHIQSNRLQPLGLLDDNIWSMYKDSRGLVWIGAGNSLNILDSRNTGIKHIFGGLDEPNGLPERKVHSVAALPDSLVIANGQAGLIQVSSENGVQKVWWPSSKDPIETLFINKQGDLFASSNFATVSLPTINRVPQPIGSSERSANTFTGAFAQRNKTLWLGGTDGLWRHSHAAPDETKQILDSSIPDRRISALLTDGDDLWVGTWQGLYKLTFEKNSDSVVSITSAKHPALQQQFISDILIDSLNQVWVATSGAGVFVSDTSQGSWEQITHIDNLPGNSVESIAGESHNQIWVGTSRGIAAINIDDKKVNPVVVGKQAVNTPYARGAATKTTDQALVFGGKNGLTIIQPLLLDTISPPLSLVFTSINVVTQQDSLHHVDTSPETLAIEPLPKRLSFEFAALDYISPESIHYRYRVVGQEEMWTELDANHRSITLTRLDPGNYELDIEYSYDRTNWYPNTLTQRFRVLPAWYQTPTADVIALIVFAFAIYFLHKLGLRHHRYRQRILEQKVAERTSELVAANQKLSEQAVALEKASLTDALTGLNNRRFLFQNIKRDLLKIQRYYNDCEDKNTRPNCENDLLFFIIDLDHFKRINDAHGHQVGDTVLIETQQRLRRVFRDTDYLIRWGGEEFLAVAHNSSRHDAHYLAERVVTIINNAKFRINEQTALKVSCSVGFAPYPLQQQHYDFFDWHTTVAVADAALYESKSRGRDTWTGVLSIKEHASENSLSFIKQQPSRIFDFAESIVRPKP